MKKNIENVENVNVVNNTTVENPIVVMDDETKQALVDDNIHFVPKNHLKRFNALSLDEQVEKIGYYQDRAARIEQWKLTNSIGYRVKDLFEKRHATVQDAKEVMKFCEEFIDNFKMREIAKIDEEIHRLELMKESL